MTHPLLRAILENPADTDARRVFTDYLEESGQEDRAEFVRTQIALAEESHEPAVCNVTGVCGACNRVMGMRRRELVLWLDGRAYWTKDFPGAIGDACNELSCWRNGFVEKVTCQTADFLAHGPAIVLAQPVMEVVLSDREPYHYTMTGWFWSHGRKGCNGPYFVPTSICRHWPDRWDKHGAATYPTMTTALSALSHACVTWARRQAGLPTFPGNDFP